MFHREDGCVINFFKLICYILVGPFVLLWKAVESIPTCINKCFVEPICAVVSFICLKISKCITAICRSVDMGGGGSGRPAGQWRGETAYHLLIATYDSPHDPPS
mmetsp:Transcript_84258/g.239383  ORF Transcript_84258/g.239383 Transcript_84258/m.239383 type:complete len:104 (-) Transcript_84258:921-1232(-)